MNFEEHNQTPSTPLRGAKSLGDANAGAYTGNKFSPMQWPSPGHSYGITSPRSFGIHRTPVHGFGTAAIGEGRLSMGQFEFGADGELVLYSAGGRALPPSADRGLRSPVVMQAAIPGALDVPKNKDGPSNVDLNDSMDKELAKAKLPGAGAGTCGAAGHLPATHLDDATPLSLGGCGAGGQGPHNMPRLSTGGIVCGTVGAVRQLALSVEPEYVDGRSGTLTDGGRCRYKTVAFASEAVLDKLNNPSTAVKAPLSPLELSVAAIAGPEQGRPKVAEEDMSSATPEMRTRKIQSLYDELEARQEILSHLQGHIYVVDQQIAKLIRTNVGLWACSAHIASCIGMALNEESRTIEAANKKAQAAISKEDSSKKPPQDGVENLVVVNNSRQSKRRRSSLGVASLTQSLNPKAQKDSKMSANIASRRGRYALGPSNVAAVAPIDDKQFLELEKIFAQPSTGEFAAGEMMSHLPLSSNALKKTGMCPVDNHDTMDAALSPGALRIQNFNEALCDELAPDCGGDGKMQMVPGHEPSLGRSHSKENSFSFHC